MTIRNSRFDSVCIKSTGSYAPAKILTNEEIVGDLPTSPEWVVKTLGVRQRRIAAPEEFTSDLAARAGLNAIASAGLEPNEIDLIIVATSTPDRKMPSSACMAQAKMGIRNGCPAFDVAAVCSGFLYGITIAGQFIQNGVYDQALVIGADTFSKVTDWNHRNCVFFGDGSGAVVLERDHRENGLFSSILFADGEGMDDFTVFPEDAYFTMNGRGGLRESHRRADRVHSADSLREPAGTRRCFDDHPAPGFRARAQARRRDTQRPLFTNADQSGVAREHCRRFNPAAAGSGKPPRTHPQERSAPVRGHRRRVDLGRNLVPMVTGANPCNRDVQRRTGKQPVK